MALNEDQSRAVEHALEAFLAINRPPKEIRHHLDLCTRFDGQTIEIFETETDPEAPGGKYESPVARVTYIDDKSVWALFFLAEGKQWLMYPTMPTASDLGEVLHTISEDAEGAFFG